MIRNKGSLQNTINRRKVVQSRERLKDQRMEKKKNQRPKDGEEERPKHGEEEIPTWTTAEISTLESEFTRDQNGHLWHGHGFIQQLFLLSTHYVLNTV